MASQAVELSRKLQALTERERACVSLVRQHPEWPGARVLREAGYSAGTAKNPAKVLERPRVVAALEAARAIDERLASYGAAELRHDLLELIDADIADALDSNGRLLPLADWPAALRRRVRTVELTPDGVGKVAFEPLLPYLRTLAKHRDVQAFSETRVERRVYVVRDYTTGGTVDAQATEPQPVEARRIDSRAAAPAASQPQPAGHAPEGAPSGGGLRGGGGGAGGDPGRGAGGADTRIVPITRENPPRKNFAIIPEFTSHTGNQDGAEPSDPVGDEPAGGPGGSGGVEAVRED